MPQVLRGGIEERILRWAIAHYPATAGELAAALGIPEKRAMMELRKMAARGLVELDALPDRVFVRPLVLLEGGREGREGGGPGAGEEGGREKEKGKKRAEGGSDRAPPGYL